MEINTKFKICTAVLACFFVSSTKSQINVSNLPDGCPTKTQKFLTHYGYLDPQKECTVDDIRTALRQFQTLNIGFEGLSITGECDNTTVRVMFLPRCGCEDIVKFQKKMMPQNFIGPQEFRLGTTKWRKKELTWSVLKYPQTTHNRKLSQSDVDGAMQRALDIWAKVTKLYFRHSKNDANADITIKFERHRHTRDPPYYDFDGEGNVLAHAFFPESGVVHFDDDERFVLNSDQGTELYIVAAHEFGHTLGISHSNIKEALMAPYYRYSTNLKLHDDDVGAIQTLYGPPDRNTSPPKTRPTDAPTPRPTAAPTPRPTAAPTPRPTKPHTVPDHCHMKIKASFNIRDTTYVFTRERISYWRTKTFVYRVTSSGIDLYSKKPIEEMFVKKSSRRYPRAYPYRVDAAAYIPDRRYLFLFSGTRAYRYSVGSRSTEGPFELDEKEKFPKWMNVTEFPERPRAAVAMPYSNYNSYYMLIFGKTMVWDWNFFSERVGAWAYPIDVFGRNMPQRVDGAYLQYSEQNAIFIKNDKFYRFNIRYRRVMDSTALDIKRDFLKGSCA